MVIFSGHFHYFTTNGKKCHGLTIVSLALSSLGLLVSVWRLKLFLVVFKLMTNFKSCESISQLKSVVFHLSSLIVYLLGQALGDLQGKLGLSLELIRNKS